MNEPTVQLRSPEDAERSPLPAAVRMSSNKSVPSTEEPRNSGTQELRNSETQELRNESQIDVARGAMRMVIEAAEYFSDRTSHLSGNVSEGLKAAETLAAVSRQIRTLSSNTSLEASRLGGNATVAEIARQMRLLSQQVTALSEHLSAGLRAQGIALGEMSGAIDAVLADATSTQAILERGPDARHDDETPMSSRLPNSSETAAWEMLSPEGTPNG